MMRLREVSLIVAFLVIVFTVPACIASAAIPGTAQPMPAAAQADETTRIYGPRGGYAEGEIVGPKQRGDEGLGSIDTPKFDAPSPVKVGISLVSFTFNVIFAVVDILLLALFAYLIYKVVRKAKGKETRLSDTIAKLRAKRAAIKEDLKARLATIEVEEVKEKG